MLGCGRTSDQEAAALLRALRASDAGAVRRRLERLRRHPSPPFQAPAGEQERWELLSAIADALGGDAQGQVSSGTRVAACRRLLEHLSG
ncbi:MAG: hypothetical protein RMK57_08070 [Bryobacterales bacterium]|nr:hypothetical protein [Bryobacteraceae bacterium]MDW8354471.1 hypothetical protein [Bryobacterales bacterium]